MPRQLSRWISLTALALYAYISLSPVQTMQKMVSQPESAVRETFGAPTETYQLADGTHHWIYSRRPLGREVYAADFDANGKLTNYRQMLTEKETYEARPGMWSRHDVFERFGTPKEPTQYYPPMKQEAWSYRMYIAGTQQAHFNVLFDDNGVPDRIMIVVDPLGGGHHNHK